MNTTPPVEPNLDGQKPEQQQSEAVQEKSMSSTKNSLRNGFILAIFALVTTGLTALTWLLTKDQIESEKELALLRAISELVPAERYTNDPYRDCVLLSDELLLGSKKPQKAWRLRDEVGNLAVLISSVAPNGYNGAINIIVGHYLNININLTLDKTSAIKTTLAGVRVTNHKETPGLGDKIETRKSNWILQFANMSTHNITCLLYTSDAADE